MKTDKDLDIYSKELAFAHNIIDIRSKKPKNIIREYWGQTVTNLPHSSILINNQLSKVFMTEECLYLVHTTRNLDEINRSGRLYSSPGNLINAVYSVPAQKMNKKIFLVHNYAKNVFRHLKKGEQNDLLPLLIKVAIPKEAKKIVGVNYLKLGPLFCKLFREESSKIPTEIINKIEIRYQNALETIKKIRKQQSPCKFRDQAKEILDLASSISKKEPLFSFFYLEALSICIMCSSFDPLTLSLLDKGETNNNLYIKAVHDLTRQPSSMFTAYAFSPTFKQLDKLLTRYQTSNFIKLDQDRCLVNMANIFVDYINLWLLNSEFIKGNINTSLKGQITALEIYFSKNRFPNTATIIKEKLSTLVWNYWNALNAAFVINSCTPKGEIGINPSFPNLKYSIWTGKFDVKKEKLKVISKLNIEINST